MLAQVADVSGALTSARALNATGHAVVIDGDESFVINKTTGEVNLIEDDGVAFNFDLWICPPEDLETMPAEGFQWPQP